MQVDEIQQQEFYKKQESEINLLKENFMKNFDTNADTFFYKESLEKMKSGEVRRKDISRMEYYKIIISAEVRFYQDIKDFIRKSEFDDSHVDLAEEYYNRLTKSIEDKTKAINEIRDALINVKDIVDEIDKITDESSKENPLNNSGAVMQQSKNNNLIFGDTFGNVTFDTLIKENENSELEEWYKFLRELHERPLKDFIINKNTICNYKLIFRNPYTGLYTDKEVVNFISHSTSSKKTPVFGIGKKRYQAVSVGAELLAGTLITLAVENVPLPYLHAISYADHISVEDLPPIDLYIVPVEAINDQGRYDVILIKGIQFVDSKQNDNAASTGIYYAFSYFAESITTVDFYEARKKFNYFNEVV